MDLERAIEFIVDQQAKMAAEQAKAAEAHRRLEEQQAKSSEKHDREMAQIRGMLSRAVRLAVQEARNERRRRRQVEEDVKRLNAAQEATAESLRSFIDSLRRGTNGSSHQ